MQFTSLCLSAVTKGVQSTLSAVSSSTPLVASNSSTSTVTLQSALPAKGQSFIGLVVGTSNAKTIKVRVARTKMHPVVHKPVTMHKNFQAHDPKESCVVGDYVRINSTPKRRGATKNFELAAILRPAHRFTDPESGILYTQPQPVKSIADLGEQRL